MKRADRSVAGPSRPPKRQKDEANERQCARVEIFFEDVEQWFTGDTQRIKTTKKGTTLHVLRFLADGYEEAYPVDEKIKDGIAATREPIFSAHARLIPGFPLLQELRG